jgi:hypothetical protein
MTPPDVLTRVQTGDFVGEYKAPVGGSDTKVPVLAVYQGEVPEELAARAGDLEETHIYKFTPPVAEVGSDTFGIAAVEGVQREEDGQVGAELTFVVGGEEKSSHTDTPNPLLKGESRFKRIFRLLTKSEGVDHLYMKPENTNLTPQEARMLGFSATSGNPDVLRLDLPGDHHSSAAS